MKIPIMTKKWIEAVWEANLKQVIKANDKIFDKYKCSHNSSVSYLLKDVNDFVM